MLKPLSIFTYYFRNKRKVIPVIAIIALSILGITAMAAFMASINRDIQKQMLFFDRYSIITVKPAQDNSADYAQQVATLKQELQNVTGVDHFFTGSLQSTYLRSILGASFAYIFFIPEDHLQQFMDTMGLTVIAGRLPQHDAPELLLSENLLVRKAVTLGSAIGTVLDPKDHLAGKYTIVGTVDTRAQDDWDYGIGQLVALQKINNFVETTYFIHPQAGQEQVVDQQLQALGQQHNTFEVMTKSGQADLLAEQYDIINMMMWALNLVTIIVIALSISFLNIIFFMQRANEFGLLAALGYSRGFIVRKTMFESIGMVIVGWISGILLAELVYTIINKTVFNVVGVQGLTIFEWRTILFSLPVPITVIIVSVITILWKLLRMDPIAIIERRD